MSKQKHVVIIQGDEAEVICESTKQIVEIMQAIAPGIRACPKDPQRRDDFLDGYIACAADFIYCNGIGVIEGFSAQKVDEKT